ncbi:hypothetical protein BO78DRAFT_422288 [Aspergillus sclerotiicarbonarius CBS 121057]|uniref:Fungal-type protein kinase domain-containing protein n=1 Tax=Aspergillus sclerotiicarbonarius (strain CBS 121057 / IBT 28362) TaxID=1448318 RepID=A0A319EG41_ASPSB|nr:hypothetical protein BO78DRAFT_422288 [Aspergillus sclerotiicarbonarius CBS 121057]
MRIQYYVSTAVSAATTAVSRIYATAAPPTITNSALAALRGLGLCQSTEASRLQFNDMLEIFGFTFVGAGNLWRNARVDQSLGLTWKLGVASLRWPSIGIPRRRISIILREILQVVKEVQGTDNLQLRESKMSIKRTVWHGMRLREINGLIDFVLWYGDPEKMETNLVVRVCQTGQILRPTELLTYMGLLQRDQERLQTKSRGVIYGILTDGTAFDFYRLDPDKTVRFQSINWDGGLEITSWILGVIYWIMADAANLSVAEI